MDFVNICVVNLPRVSLAEIKSKFRDKVGLNLAIIINLIKVMCIKMQTHICGWCQLERKYARNGEA